MLKQITTDKAPKAIGPYSQAILDKETNVIYVSGQIAIDPETNTFDETQDIEQQTERIMQNIEAILKEAGSNINNTLKIRIYLTDMSDFPKINEIYGSYFTNHKPARATIGVASLPLGAKIEIECEAKAISKQDSKIICQNK